MHRRTARVPVGAAPDLAVLAVLLQGALETRLQGTGVRVEEMFDGFHALVIGGDGKSRNAVRRTVRDVTSYRLLLLLRYGLPSLLTIVGFVILFAVDSSSRWDGFAMCIGSALSLVFFSVVFHMGATGDLERDDEESARAYLREHGHWPDEQPRSRAPRGS